MAALPSLGAYSSLVRIGGGSYGSVFSARDAQSNAVAIKIIAEAGRGCSGGAAARARLSAVAELKVLRAVASAHVLRLRDAFVCERDVALVLDLGARSVAAGAAPPRAARRGAARRGAAARAHPAFRPPSPLLSFRARAVTSRR
jgi:hypothetical protein